MHKPITCKTQTTSHSAGKLGKFNTISMASSTSFGSTKTNLTKSVVKKNICKIESELRNYALE